MPKIFVSTHPFGALSSRPLELLRQSRCEFQINPLERKLTSQEVAEMAANCDALIAGTENIALVLEKAPNIKIISRVGIGLDSIPLKECRKRNVVVCYTPDAVTMAVAELTVGLMLNITRFIHATDRQIRTGVWQRIQGRRLGKSVIGLIGFGRIGNSVARLLAPYHPCKVLINDIKDKSSELQIMRQAGLCVEIVPLSRIYHESHIISLHVPLNSMTLNLIAEKQLSQMRSDAFLINTARGGIVNEQALHEALSEGKLGGAALDVFEEEPYTGSLAELDNVLLTPHMGSCSHDCRAQMEIEATKEIIRFFQGERLQNEVPEEEYVYQEKYEKFGS